MSNEKRTIYKSILTVYSDEPLDSVQSLSEMEADGNAYVWAVKCSEADMEQVPGEVYEHFDIEQDGDDEEDDLTCPSCREALLVPRGEPGEADFRFDCPNCKRVFNEDGADITK
jgi:hypothetical protein